MNLIIIIIAISLSMDAFSLSLAYGTYNLKKTSINILSVIVGIYHFFMPLIGLTIGSVILKYIRIDTDIIVFIVLIFIGIEMIVDSFKEQEIKELTILESIVFGFAVSIDSFSVGIGLKSLSNNYLICSLVFSITSSFFTLLGLYLGKKINKLIGNISTIIGGTILIIIGIMYVL